MNGRLKDMAYSRDGENILVITTRESCKKLWDQWGGDEITFTVKKKATPRSLNANAMCWAMCQKIAEKLGITKEEVYRKCITEVGDYTPLPIKAEAVEDFQRIWSSHGIGWICQVVDNSKIEGYKLVFAYAGSSTYDTKQMSRLIDCIMQEAETLGIETLTDRERSLLIDAWSSS